MKIVDFRYPDTKREWLEQKAALKKQRNIIRFAEALEFTIQTRIGVGGCISDGELHDFAMKYLAEYPYYSHSKRQAALHESGHFVAAWVFGNGAHIAAISGSSSPRIGWGGDCYINPPIQQAACISEQLVNDAKVLLAGPLAGDYIGDSDALRSGAEIVEAWLLVGAGAHLQNTAPKPLIVSILDDMNRFVTFYKSEIREIAEMLITRKTIYATSPSVKSVIKVIEAKAPHLSSYGHGRFDDRRLKSEILELKPAQDLLAKIMELNDGR